MGDRAVVSVQDPIQLDDISEPQPDVCLVVPPLARYRERHPAPEDVLLVVEVSDASLASDRATKTRLYALAGIREAWLLDIAGRALEIYRSPSPAGYGEVSRVQTGTLSPLAFPDVALSVDELLS